MAFCDRTPVIDAAYVVRWKSSENEAEKLSQI